ncbi:type II secretion system major pseudopilin GspG [Opitutus sp. GAS368]|uniref:type II secretion system major pseudopilin GspG n=1 Tax=Opitutus sp. GAS368 TaxID=1882749 RepID=UPI0008792E34|nr:type II secretion system major pseudopilin GspG [Opitutus sp. GAS368]SDS41883.1 general secretion pathway protein G [Opitutus sp. GAS368]
MKTPAARAPLPRRSLGEGGFTLLEILVVLAIIGLLVGLVVSNTDKIFGQSQVAVARIFVRDTLKTPLTRYRMDMGDYPSTAEGLQALVTPPSARTEAWHGPYLDAPGGRLPTDPWGEPYQYRYPGIKNPGGCDIFSKGPDKVADTEDDIGNW